MEAYVRRVLELQGRIPSGRLPSHVVGDLALNGADESRFPWTLSIIRGEVMAFANNHLSGQGPDMSFIAHRLRTQAASEPKVARHAAAGAGSSSELSAIRAELAKLQRQLAHSTSVAHTAAISTAGQSNTNGASASSSDSSASKRSRRPGARRGPKQQGTGASGTGDGQRKQLDDDELARRFDAGLCFECNEPGHIGRDCPERAARKKQQKQERLQQQGAERAPSSEN